MSVEKKSADLALKKDNVIFIMGSWQGKEKLLESIQSSLLMKHASEKKFGLIVILPRLLCCE